MCKVAQHEWMLGAIIRYTLKNKSRRQLGWKWGRAVPNRRLWRTLSFVTAEHTLILTKSKNCSIQVIPWSQKIKPGGGVVHIKQGLLTVLNCYSILFLVIFFETLIVWAWEWRLRIQMVADFSHVKVLKKIKLCNNCVH